MHKAPAATVRSAGVGEGVEKEEGCKEAEVCCLR
jgi:hypothetical protein